MGNYTGPYRLTRQEIARVVTQNGPGNYLLGNKASEKNLHVKYVGRDDVSVRTRLEQHASEGDYNYFQFRCTTSVKDAYEQECLAFHAFRQHIDNVNHPAVPKGKDYPCPYPRCEHHKE